MRRRTSIQLLTALAVAAPALLSAAAGAKDRAAAQAANPRGSSPFGLISFSPHGIHAQSPEERAAAYARLRRAGVRAIRLDISWSAIEPEGEPLGDYDFSAVDREVAAITDAGLKIVGLLGYGHSDYSMLGGAVDDSPTAGNGVPPFYVGSDQYFPPDDPADFATYARAVAHHYGREVIAWEVWNEQNEGWRFWAPHEDPDAYAALLCAAHGALERTDPATPVVYGGVFYPALPGGLPGMSGPDFVRASYEADPDLGRCFDALAYHPYPYPFTAPELDVPIRGSVLSAERGMRRAMPKDDRDKPLWITEIGWPTHDTTYGVSEEKQAQYLARMLAASFAQGLPVVSWYTYGDFGGDPIEANQEAHFGVFDPGGEPKLAHTALRVFTRMVRGARFSRDLARRLDLSRGEENVGGRGFALRYSRPGERVTAIWFANESVAEAQGVTPGGGTVTGGTLLVELPVGAPRVRVVDHLGGVTSVTAENGAVGIKAGPGIQYVVERERR